MPTVFTNEKRIIGSTTEGFGEYATVWHDYEILCPCGNWTKDYGDVSTQLGDDPDEQTWLCPTCIAKSEAA